LILQLLSTDLFTGDTDLLILLDWSHIKFYGKIEVLDFTSAAEEEDVELSLLGTSDVLEFELVGMLFHLENLTDINIEVSWVFALFLTVKDYFFVDCFVDVAPQLLVPNQEFFIHVDENVFAFSAVDAFRSTFSFAENGQSQHTNWLLE